MQAIIKDKKSLDPNYNVLNDCITDVLEDS